MLIQIANLLIQSLGSLFLFMVLLRLLLQLSRADFYNPASQMIVKITNPLLRPLRRMIPSLGGLDTASLVLALAVQLLILVAILLINFGSLPNILVLLLWSVIGCLAMVVKMYFFIVLAGIVLSWVAAGSYHPMVILIHQLTEPALAPFRKILPAMGGMDFSPIFLFIAINIAEIVLRYCAGAVGLPTQLVFGL
jgi:YggT family protein